MKLPLFAETDFSFHIEGWVSQLFFLSKSLPIAVITL